MSRGTVADDFAARLHFDRSSGPGAGFCTIYRTLCSIFGLRSAILYDESYTLPNLRAPEHNFVRSIVHFDRFSGTGARFCTIFRTLCSIFWLRSTILYDLSYTLLDLLASEHNFVRYIVHFDRFSGTGARFCTIFRTLCSIFWLRSTILYDISYTLPALRGPEHDFVRSIVHFARSSGLGARFCTIYRTLCPLFGPRSTILYDGSYTLLDLLASEHDFVRSFVHFTRSSGSGARFCTIYRTLRPIFGPRSTILYDISYTLLDLRASEQDFVRYIVHFDRFSGLGAQFCTIYRTLRSIFGLRSRILYDLSYTSLDFRAPEHDFVRYIVHFAQSSGSGAGFCTMNRTLRPIFGPRSTILYDISYTSTDFRASERNFVRYIVHFARIRPSNQGFCTIFRTLRHRPPFDSSHHPPC
jgi:hypothetical protein